MTGKWAKDIASLVRPIAELREDPKNARRHPVRNLDAICGSLKEFGQQKPIVVDDKGIVIAGNGTLKAALTLGWTGIAATTFDGSKPRAYALADNRTGELAEWDYQELSGALREQDEELLNAIGWTNDEIEPLLQAEWAPQEIDENASSAADNPHKHAVIFTPEQWQVIERATGKRDRAEVITELCRQAAG